MGIQNRNLQGLRGKGWVETPAFSYLLERRCANEADQKEEIKDTAWNRDLRMTSESADSSVARKNNKHNRREQLESLT